MRQSPDEGNIKPAGGERNALRDALLTIKQAAALLSMSVRTLQARRDIARLDVRPPGSKRPMIRYRRDDINAYIASRTRAD